LINQSINWIIWSFRVDSFDTQGNLLNRVPIEMRGRSFLGAINEGDMVEVSQVWLQAAMIQPPNVRNLTTGVVVRAKGTPIGEMVFFTMLIIVAFVMIVSVLQFLGR
jgi:hypothetical protein